MALDVIISTFTPYIIGAIFGVVGMFTTGFAKEFFSERARTKKHRIDVAREVYKVINEASSEVFTMNHVIWST